MSSVLDRIVASTRERLSSLPRGEPRGPRPDGRFVEALRGRDRISVIAEVKRKSPSRGALAPTAKAPAQAARYESAGAAAVSVLTEPTYFGGDFQDLVDVGDAVALPLLMKDFVVDPEQVRVAALLGASAVLALLRIVDDPALDEILAACRTYGVEPLMECHDEAEVARALARDVTVIGVNNRDLGDLEIDRQNAVRLLPRIGAEHVGIAESGYLEPGDVAEVRSLCDAVLVGSALMTREDPETFIREVSRCA